MYYNGYQPLQQNSSITWVQGENGAKSFPVGAGQTAWLMDSENQVFYLKTVDVSGMPLPLRVFDFTERKVKQPASDHDDMYITRDEFEKRIKEIMNHGKSALLSDTDGSSDTAE